MVKIGCLPIISSEAAINGMSVYSNLTLRDYFAGQALAGMDSEGKDDVEILDASWVAKRAYRIADAMITERAAQVAELI